MAVDFVPQKFSSDSIFLKKILVPIDFSQPCLKAMDYALVLAQHFGSQIILVHVIRKINPATRIVVDRPKLQNRLKEEGQRLLNTFVKKHICLKVSLDKIIRTGVPFDEIVMTAKRYNVDAIVIATHGYSGLKHITMGSTAERVVRYAPCPVLVVREKEHEFIIKKK
ncbi:MAG: universal stress protein [Verrucomicrobiia bacterium]